MSLDRYKLHAAFFCFAAVVNCCASAVAEIEIKTFTRYRIDNFDNNNNGYVDDENESARLSPVESNLVASEISGFEGEVGRFRIYNERFRTRRFFQSQGVRLEQIIRFQPIIDAENVSNPSPPHDYWEISVGACYSQIDDQHGFDGSGGILGRMYATTEIDSSYLGPAIGLHRNFENAGWQYAIGGSLQFAFHATDGTQNGAIGEDLQPGAVNRPIFAKPHNVVYSDSDNAQSLSGELRAQASRPLNTYTTFNLGYSSFYFGNMRYASDSINWFIPDLGLVDNGTQDIFVGTFYANIEFRR